MKTNKLQILVLKETYQVGFAMDLGHSLKANIDLRRGWLTNITKKSPTKRTYPVTHRSIFNELLSNLEDYYNMQTSSYVPLNNVNVYLLNARNNSQEYMLIYSIFTDNCVILSGWTYNAQIYQYFNQSAEKGIAQLVTILHIYQVVVFGIAYHVTLDISNPPKDKLHALYANTIQLQISIKQNVCHLHIHTLESVT